jgi:CopG family nickel-responsive transcriptional regulator
VSILASFQSFEKRAAVNHIDCNPNNRFRVRFSLFPDGSRIGAHKLPRSPFANPIIRKQGAPVRGVQRFSVSVEPELLRDFDRYCKRHRFATRSEAVRQALRELLTREAWETSGRTVVGTLTLVYEHERAQVRDRLLELQHENADLIVSVLHVHLSHELCLEVLILRGEAGRLRAVANELRGMKGVQKGELVLAGIAEGARPHH